MRKIRINERQWRYITEAKDLDFSYEELERLSPEEKVAYCDKHLGNSFSSGSARKCYMLNDNYVLKVAYNEKGYGQNKFESELMGRVKSFIFPELKAVAKDYSYVVMEHVLPCSYEDFEKVFGLPFGSRWRQNSAKKSVPIGKGDMKVGYNKYFDGTKGEEEEYEGTSISDVIWYIEDSYSLGQDDCYDAYEIVENEKMIRKSPWLSELKRLTSTYHLTDLSQMENYGLVKRDGKLAIVLLDCGLDLETFEKYYS